MSSARRVRNEILILQSMELERTNFLVIGVVYLILTSTIIYSGWSSHALRIDESIFFTYRVDIVRNLLIENMLHTEPVQLILIIVVGGLFSLNLVNRFRDRTIHTLVLLTDSKTVILLSMLIINFIMIYVGVAVPILIDLLLINATPPQISKICLYIAPEILMYTSIALFFSLATRNEILTILGLYIVNSGLNRLLSLYDYEVFLTIRYWYKTLSGYYGATSLVHNILIVTYWIGIPLAFIATSIIYFNSMELD